VSKVSVVIPVYYNEQSLPLLFEELLKIEEALRRRNHDLELIFVDDGSGDNSMGELLRSSANVRGRKSLNSRETLVLCMPLNRLSVCNR